MENYNNYLLNEIQKLKETTNSIQGISKTFEILETIANRHMKINSSFEENLAHLNKYNEQFSDLNNAIKTNILDLKETALKFPAQLNDISDKNKTNIEICEKNLLKSIIEVNEKTIKTLSHGFDDILSAYAKIKLFLFLLLFINIFLLVIMIYKIFLV